MASDESEQQVITDNGETLISSTIIAEDDKDKDVLKLISDAVREVPANAIKDLWSIGVCARCIFRVLGLHELICSHPSLSYSVLITVLGVVRIEGGDGVDSSAKHELLNIQELTTEANVCKICLGVLQFVFSDENGTLLKKDSAYDFASKIAELVKQQQHHQIGSFSLEVSLPPLVTENDQAIWLYVQKKYESELWFQQKAASQCFSTKDVLKLLVIKPLQTLLGLKHMESTFHIRLTYSGSLRQQNANERNVGNKRRKTDSAYTQSVDIQKVEGEAFTRTSSLKSQKDCFDYVKLLIEKVIQPCHLTTQCYRNPIYIGGRYLKYSRNVSQTRWVIDDERMGEASVEEILGGCILPLCQGDGYKFHAAGREDIDVRMLGTGRPFLVEIQNARQVPSEGFIKDIEIKINSLENQLVKVRNLKSLGSQGWAMINEGEAEKQKQYSALVWISRDVNNEDLQTISSVKDMKIIQKTPIRVLHRRSPMEREKIIHWMKLERLEGSSQYFLLHLCTQAGTYIKEFVHGDLGRTNPSIGSMLGCRAEILQLDVTDVKMDCF
ncbi:PREDICTED: putative tRNA pseudouridine synthase Pus10 isoform X2 [Ipomoea nil]|uniref:putative tRNA pseudouridine synthase Pus10 isoform X2 n=1 Tax=Ipomoea nil TaxID=35883 RepID=UPI000901E04A|nr:PREDICTED: putative tRNA pseudouridine synthase Pus10 isoform X2 [Ipomoea nil]